MPRECTRGLSELSLKRGHGGPEEARSLEPWLRREHGRIFPNYTSILGTLFLIEVIVAAVLYLPLVHTRYPAVL